MPSNAIVDALFNQAMFAYHIFVIFICIVLSFLTRRCWIVFAESTQLSVAIYLTSVLGLIVIIMKQIQVNAETVFYTNAYFWIVGSCTILLVLFANRLRKARTSRVAGGTSKTSEQSDQGDEHRAVLQYKKTTFVEVISGTWISNLIHDTVRVYPSTEARVTPAGLLYLPEIQSSVINLQRLNFDTRRRQGEGVAKEIRMNDISKRYTILCHSEESYKYWMLLLDMFAKKVHEKG
jgi:hypothetical protein